MFLPKPPGCFLLPLPPCLPHSERRSLCLVTVVCPPPAAMHRGQISFVWACLGQAGIKDLTANTNWSETSWRKSACAGEKRFLRELSTIITPTLSPCVIRGTAQYDLIPSATLGCSSRNSDSDCRSCRTIRFWAERPTHDDFHPIPVLDLADKRC